MGLESAIIIRDGKEFVIRVPDTEGLTEVFKALFGIEEIPTTNLVPLPPNDIEEKLEEANALQLQFLKSQISEVSSDILRNRLQEKGVSEKDFFLGKRPDLICEIYDLIKEFEELF